MIDKKILGPNEQNNYDLAVKYVDIVLLAPKTVQLLKTNENFEQIISRAINFVTYYEENYEIPSTNATKFTQAYYSLVNKNVLFDEKFNYADNDEVLDNINYIGVFVKNITGMDWAALEASLKTNNGVEGVSADASNETKTPKEESVDAQRVDASEANNWSNQSNSGYSNQNSYNFNTNAYGNFNPNDIAETIIGQQAAAMLNMNILSGKVYQYKTKPVVIPILKYLLTATFILMTILTIISFALLIYTSSRTSLYLPVIGSSTFQKATNWASAFPYQMLMFILTTAMLTFSLVRTNKNDNFKYRFAWIWPAIYLALLLFITFVQSGVNGSIVFNYNEFLSWFLPPSNPDVAAANQHFLVYIETFRGIQLALYGLLALSVVLIVAAALLNPKRDLQRLQELLDQYADDIRYGRVNPDDYNGGGSPFGSRFGTGWF